MDTELYGQVPIYSREQIRKLYAKSVKASFDEFSLEKLVETGIMPFPKDEELQEYDESVEVGLNHAMERIRESDVTDLPEFFMIDTEKRSGSGKGVVWVIAGGEVVDFTQTPVSNTT
jgi:hypothetical protein